MDAHIKHRVLDTAVIVVDKTGHSTLSHCRNKLSAGKQSVGHSDVTVLSYQTSVECVKYE